MPGGIVTKNRVEIPIQKDVSIVVQTVCYPKYIKETKEHPIGYQPCHLVIWWFAPDSKSFEFINYLFMAQDINNLNVRYDIESSEYKIFQVSPLRPGMPGKGIIVELNYKMPPQKFKLKIPDVIIDEKAFVIPEVLFTHTKNIEIVPFFANF